MVLDQRFEIVLAQIFSFCSSAETVPAAPRLLSNTACALSRLGIEDAPLLDAISSASLRLLSDFAPQELAGLAWSVAKC